jgi:Uma2 family endonuclease
MGLALRDHHRHTYGEYLTWSEAQRYQLIDGEAYLMAPAPTVRHQEVAGEIYLQLRRALDGGPCRVLIAPVDVLLPKADEADEAVDTVVQPDVLVVCDPAKIRERNVRGAPDLAVEVLSPATSALDQIRKRHHYERSGVREYWLVHPLDRVVTVYRLEGARFGMPQTHLLEGTTPVGILPGVAIRWDDLVKRLPPADY